MDIWEIELDCYEGGCMKTIKKDEAGYKKVKKTEISKKTGEEIDSIYFARKMSNYCSIGLDARIGYGFDKNRTESRTANKLVYGWEGFKKFVTAKCEINAVIEKMEVIDKEKPKIEENSLFSPN